MTKIRVLPFVLSGGIWGCKSPKDPKKLGDKDVLFVLKNPSELGFIKQGDFIHVQIDEVKDEDSETIVSCKGVGVLDLNLFKMKFAQGKDEKGLFCWRSDIRLEDSHIEIIVDMRSPKHPASENEVWECEFVSTYPKVDRLSLSVRTLSKVVSARKKEGVAISV